MPFTNRVPRRLALFLHTMAIWQSVWKCVKPRHVSKASDIYIIQFWKYDLYPWCLTWTQIEKNSKVRDYPFKYEVCNFEGRGVKFHENFQTDTIKNADREWRSKRLCETCSHTTWVPNKRRGPNKRVDWFFPLLHVKQWAGRKYFLTFFCMFLNPNIFFQFRNEKSPGTS